MWGFYLLAKLRRPSFLDLMYELCLQWFLACWALRWGTIIKIRRLKKNFSMEVLAANASSAQFKQALLGRMWLCVAAAQANVEVIPRGHDCSVQVDFSVVLRRVVNKGARPYYERSRSLNVILTDKPSKRVLKSTVIASEPSQKWYCDELPPPSAVRQRLGT